MNKNEIYLITGLYYDSGIGLLQVEVLHRSIKTATIGWFISTPHVCKRDSPEGKNAIESLPMQALLLGVKHMYYTSTDVKRLNEKF